MEIRGLQFPPIELPDGIVAVLDQYLERSDDDCEEILHCGVSHPELILEGRVNVELAAGLRALRDPEQTPSFDRSAIAFIYLLHKWKMMDAACRTLDFLEEFLTSNGRGIAQSPFHPAEDPFYVRGLLLFDSDWLEGDSLPEAVTWFERSLARGDGLQFPSMLLSAIAVTEHQRGRFEEAAVLYRRALSQTELDAERERREVAGSEDPNLLYVYDLARQASVLRDQLRRCEENTALTAELTVEGFPTQ